MNHELPITNANVFVHLDSFLNELPDLRMDLLEVVLQRTIIPYHRHPACHHGERISIVRRAIHVTLRCHQRDINPERD